MHKKCSSTGLRKHERRNRCSRGSAAPTTVHGASEAGNTHNLTHDQRVAQPKQSLGRAKGMVHCKLWSGVRAAALKRQLMTRPPRTQTNADVMLLAYTNGTAAAHDPRQFNPFIFGER